MKGEKGKENNGGRNLGMMKKRKQKWAQIDGAMEGDNLKKAMERRKKALDRHDKKKRNKRFRDNEKFHPKKPLSPFLPFLKKKALPPVWPAVHLKSRSSPTSMSLSRSLMPHLFSLRMWVTEVIT